METKKLLIDMDDVVAELLEYCCNEHYLNGNEKYVHTDIDDWEFNGIHFSYLFNMPGTFLKLNVMRYAKECLKFLHDIGYEIWFVTTPSTPTSIVEKMEWVENNFPFLGWKRVFPTTNKGMVIGNLLLDDAPHNLSRFTSGLKICYGKLYNRGVDCDYRVHNWLEFTELVLRLPQLSLIN